MLFDLAARFDMGGHLALESPGVVGVDGVLVDRLLAVAVVVDLEFLADLGIAGPEHAALEGPGAARGQSLQRGLAGGADRDGDVYVINGTKHWITGGGVSINKEKISDLETVITSEDLLNGKYILAQAGKKKYSLIIVK